MAARSDRGGGALDVSNSPGPRLERGRRYGPWGLTVLIGVVGVAGYVAGGWNIGPSVLSEPYVWLIAAGFAVAEIFTIDLPFKSHRHSYSMSEVPAVLGLFFLTPAELIFASMIGAGVAFLGARRQTGLKLAFNFSLQFAGTVLLLLVFEAIAESRTPTQGSAILGAYAAIGISAVLSHIAVFAVISLVERFWDRVLFGQGLWFGVVTQMANASLGLVGVLLVDIGWPTIFILLTPVVVMFAAYRSLGRRVLVEEQLRLSELRFEALIRASSDVTALVAPDATLRYVSDAARDVLGVDPADMLGRHASDLIVGTPDVVGDFLVHLDEAKRSTEPVMFDVACKHRDDSDLQLEVHMMDLSTDPAVEATLMSIRNVTDRRRLEERLTQAQKMDAIGQLAGGIAHDFNNLLAVIQNYAQFVRADLPPTSPSGADVDEILGATQTASGLTQQLLSFARKEMVRPKVVSVNKVVSSVHRMLSRTIEESIELRAAPAAADPHVKIDPGRLEHVLINLVVNAKDAMPDGGSVTLGTSVAHVGPSLASDDLGPGDYAMVTVEDTGVGIPPSMRERIFEPFFTTKPKGHGTGLGLATVYGIVKQFQGHIEVESEVGKGSTFKIYLPIAEGAEHLDDGSSRVPALEGSGTILVAEDSEPLRKLVRRILANASYTVVEAASGVDAVQQWRERGGKIDLLLTDVVMPKMSGRELSEVTGLPTVFVSGYTDEILSQDDVESSGYFLQKPFSATELLAIVAEALSASGSRSPGRAPQSP